MSLHTIVGDGIAARLAQRRAATASAAVARQPQGSLAVLLTGMSMRFLETSLAVTAIAVALLIGVGR